MLTLFAKYKRSSLAFLTAAAVITASSAPRADSTFEVPPVSLPGPFPVACSNVVQDFTRVGSGASASDYWEGIPRSSGGSRYATDLLADPANTLSVAVTAPSDGSLFSSFAGRTIPYVLLVCYPTGSANPRPDYVLPTGKALPHMQRGNEPPEFADATARYPLLLFSHGYGGSPLSNDYIDPIMVFASFGYVVAAPFHGDPRVRYWCPIQSMPGPDPLQPLRIPESRLLFIYVADIRRGAAGRTDCCSRMAGLQGSSPLRETESWLVSFGNR